MADDHADHPTNRVGKALMNTQQALEERLAELKEELRRSSTTLSTVEGVWVKRCKVRCHCSILRNGSQFNFQSAFPSYSVSKTFKGSPGFNNLVDNIWHLRCRQERRFDPLLYLRDDVMHEALLFAVSLWDIAESREREIGITPKNHINGPLVFTGVSRQWNVFITSSPQLWSHLLIDTDDDNVIEYLQLFLLLSRDQRLFIVLHGSAAMPDGIVTELLKVGHRIDALVYPPSVSRSTLAKLGYGASRQFEKACSWYRLKVQSVTRPLRRANHYLFPASIQGLWLDGLDGLFLLSNFVILPQFRSLASLTMRISYATGISLVPGSILEFPNLERLSLQVAFASDRQVERPISMNCQKLERLHLGYTLELNPNKPQLYPAPWLGFGVVGAVQRLQIQLAIRVMTDTGLSRQQRQEQRELERYSLFTQPQYWHRWCNPLHSPEYPRQDSLEVTLSANVKEYEFVRDIAEENLLLEIPQLRELTTSKIFPVFPERLQKLCLQGYSIPDPFSPTNLLNLVSLEIKANTLSDLSIMDYIQVSQLRDLRIQVQDGPGGVHKYDWRNIIGNQLDYISLRIGMRRHKRDNRALVFRLPRTHSLNVFSPHVPLSLFLAEPGPLPFTLCADLDELSAGWQENSITEWISPQHGVPDLASFEKLTCLQRIVLHSGQYVLRKRSPIDELFNLLAQNIHMCPHLTSVTVAQCPSSWPIFLRQLGKRNRKALLSKATKCIEELSFYQPLHMEIISWLMDTIKAKVFEVTRSPIVRQGDAWPMRPFEKDKRVFRSCYVCHITGMEPGCQKNETQSVDCGRERDEGSVIRAL
jgi:hypothetical protein